MEERNVNSGVFNDAIEIRDANLKIERREEAFGQALAQM